MENSINFTHFYARKSSYRCLKNDRNNILTKRNKSSFDIAKHIVRPIIDNDFFEDFDLYIKEIQRAFRRSDGDDFECYFQELRKITKCGDYVPASDITVIMFRILEDIIPRDFYSLNRHRKAFYDLVKFVLDCSLGQRVTEARIVKKWDVGLVSWLSRAENKESILFRVLSWILKNIVCSIVAVNFYVTITRLTTESRKLYFFFKSDWQIFREKFMKEVLAKGHLKKHNGSKHKDHSKNIPTLRLMLKPDFSMRPIVVYKKMSSYEKSAYDRKRSFFNITRSNYRKRKFSELYEELFFEWKSEKEPMILYFVKADLADAFGSVDIDKLKTCLRDLNEEFQNNPKKKWKDIVSQEYEKLIEDLNSPFLVRKGSLIYEWKKGLVQGTRSSPNLCDIYYDSFDREFFGKFYEKNGIELFVRLVDDYLYITHNRENAIDFLRTAEQTGKFNKNKTVINFEFNGYAKSEIIQFYGYTINTNTLEIGRDETVYKGQIRHRIIFNSIDDPEDFLSSRISRMTIPLFPLYFNLCINCEQTVWNNVFVTLCIAVSKFCTIIEILDLEDANKIFNAFKHRIVINLCRSMSRYIDRYKKDIDFESCDNHYAYLSYKVLDLYVGNSKVCSKFRPIVKKYMKITNCMEGQWKPHLSKTQNDLVIKACITICRRESTRFYISKLNQLPTGFEYVNGRIKKD